MDTKNLINGMIDGARLIGIDMTQGLAAVFIPAPVAKPCYPIFEGIRSES